jgi:hypothetical protein
VKKLNLGQRIVLVVALGIFLAGVGRAVMHHARVLATGWTGFAPSVVTRRGSFFVVQRAAVGHPGLRLLILVVLFAIWVAGALWLLKDGGPASLAGADDLKE